MTHLCEWTTDSSTARSVSICCCPGGERKGQSAAMQLPVQLLEAYASVTACQQHHDSNASLNPDWLAANTHTLIGTNHYLLCPQQEQMHPLPASPAGCHSPPPVSLSLARQTSCKCMWPGTGVVGCMGWTMWGLCRQQYLPTWQSKPSSQTWSSVRGLQGA
jgi:hypothetical protein